jgi:hypothetical protein
MKHCATLPLSYLRVVETPHLSVTQAQVEVPFQKSRQGLQQMIPQRKEQSSGQYLRRCPKNWNIGPGLRPVKELEILGTAIRGAFQCIAEHQNSSPTLRCVVCQFTKSNFNNLSLS